MSPGITLDSSESLSCLYYLVLGVNRGGTLAGLVVKITAADEPVRQTSLSLFIR